MNRRGELSSQQIVVLVILIASFGIILFFFSRLNLGETSEQEICHNSVITRGSSVLPADSIPLNCRRSYVCLTEDGSCESLTKPIKKEVKTREDVYNVLAEEMATCWWMFGEGKVNYVGDDFSENLYCSICSQIAFDESVQNIFQGGIMNEQEFYQYMQDNNVSGRKNSYLSYLYGFRSVEDAKMALSEKELGFGTIDLNQQQYALMGIISEKSTFQRVLVGVGVGVVLVGGALLTPLTGGLSLVSTSGMIYTLVGATTGGTLVGFTGEGPTGEQFFKPSIIEVNSEEFKALGCKSINTLS